MQHRAANTCSKRGDDVGVQVWLVTQVEGVGVDNHSSAGFELLGCDILDLGFVEVLLGAPARTERGLHLHPIIATGVFRTFDNGSGGADG